jgi:hypothetical protein
VHLLLQAPRAQLCRVIVQQLAKEERKEKELKVSV